MSIRAEFTAALDGLVAQIRQDGSILAAILCGSLSHDTVWAKSDIDLVLITVDDKPRPGADDIALNADGVNVHAFLMSRRDFRAAVEGSLQHSFMHSLLAKGRLLYTHDDSIARLWQGLHDLGARDREIQLLHAATSALPPLYKAHKWFETRGDLDYTALWLLYTATSIAQIEVIAAGMIPGREVIPEATRLNPALFETIYTSLLNKRKTSAQIAAALDTVDRYIASRATTLFALVLAYLRAAGEARSCSEIENHFTRSLGVHGATTACEYLADQRLIGKVSLPARLTKKSTITVQELAFVYLDGPPDDEEWQPR